MKRWVVVFALLSLLATAFIWGNSLRTVEQADEMNKSVSQVVRPSVDPGKKVEENTFRKLLSKAAHIVEFAALGFCVAGLAISLGKCKDRNYVALPLFLVLSVAVLDEFIQTFSGRGSAVTDILIDFTGAMLGFGLAALGLLLLRLANRLIKAKTS